MTHSRFSSSRCRTVDTGLHARAILGRCPRPPDAPVSGDVRSSTGGLLPHRKKRRPMRRRDKTPMQCMFCGGDESLGLMNKEHFVPRALWAGKRPPGTITVPAHLSCNQSFSDDNDYFRTFLV